MLHPQIRPFAIPIQVIRQVEDLQVVGAAGPVDKLTRSKPSSEQDNYVHKGAVLQPLGPGRAFKGFKGLQYGIAV